MTSSQQPPRAFLLAPRVMHYDWGKIGAASAVARLAHPTNFAAIDATRPYAELWMGTHPNAPADALLHDTNGSTHASTPLPTLLAAHRARLLAPTHADLPFLLKVLSVAKPLSIQAHPARPQARALHAARPDLYRDPNHKPEMAIALTPFRALYGFRARPAIAAHLASYPELARVAGDKAVQAYLSHTDTANDVAALRDLFGAVMRADPDVVRAEVAALVARVTALSEHLQTPTTDATLVHVNAHFPGDVGVLCVLLMHVVDLQPGDALYLGAGVLHAYLSGDCIEVMATSDNVVRAGLTPKFKDLDTLLTIGAFTAVADPRAALLAPVPAPGNVPYTLEYDPPIDEFTVHRTAIPEDADHDSVDLPAIQGASVVLVTEARGDGTPHLIASGPGDADVSVPVHAGSVVFVAPGTRLQVTSGRGLVLYRAYCDHALPADVL
ncbi:RmlC-like cupin domain-containing protein [Blastocladiella britannica]|nr:RmlC-like cupin domain-containing protein [Blastocladiella britannica]